MLKKTISILKNKNLCRLVCRLVTTREITSSASIKESFASRTNQNYYIAGFVDGEGCFSVSFRKCNRFKIKIEVRPSFSVGQKRTRANLELLKNIKKVFKGGSIRVDKNDDLYKYETRSLAHILENVLPFFKRYPLKGEKRYDFERFCKICLLIVEKRHLDASGLSIIFDIAEKMNISGKRRVSLSSLRDLL